MSCKMNVEGCKRQLSTSSEKESKRVREQPLDDASECSDGDLGAACDISQGDLDVPGAHGNSTNDVRHMHFKDGVIPDLGQHAPQPTHLVVENLTDPTQLDRLNSPEILRSLDLRKSNLGSGFPTSIVKMASLQELKLVRSGLKDLPLGFGELSKLTDLDLSKCDFSSGLPSSIDCLVSLNTLVLCNCRLTRLPNQLGRVKTLQALNLSSNNFSEELPEVIAKFDTLKKLKLRSCELTSLPLWLKDLKKLEALDLAENKFSPGLPDVISECSSLTELTLENCQLEDLPSTFHKLCQLKSLILSNNNFSGGLPKVIGQLSELKKLDLWDCQLTDLPPSFEKLGQLQELNLGRNNLRTISPIVYNLGKLKELVVAENHDLQTVDEKILQLQELDQLDCENCKSIQHPPYHVCLQGIEAMRQYFGDPSNNGKFCDVPIIIIGSQECGKRSLIRKLGYSTDDEDGGISERNLDPAIRVLEENKMKLGNLTTKVLTCGSLEEYPQALRHCQKCIVVAVVNIKEFREVARKKGEKEATRSVLFDRLSHVYHACPSMEAPLLVLTRADELDDPVEKYTEELLKAAEALRLTLLQEPKRIPPQEDQHEKASHHLLDTSKLLFHQQEIFSVSNNCHEISAIKSLREALVMRTEKYASANCLLSEIENYLKAHDKPCIEKSELDTQFSQHKDLDKCLESMHNAGTVLWLKKVKGLLDYVFPHLDAIKDMFVSLFPYFSSSSREKWEEQGARFQPFTYKNNYIGQQKYGELVQCFISTGLLDEALLVSLLENKGFPEKVALDLLKCFHIIFGPLVNQENTLYIVPTFASKPTGVNDNGRAPLQLRVDICLEGLALPQYVYQFTSRTFLEKFPSLHSLETPAKVRKNGATIRYEESEIHLAHEPDFRKLKLTVFCTVQDLAMSWKNLVNVVISIRTMLSNSWKAARLEVVSYCAHCLFRQDPKPSSKVNPNWSKCNKNVGTTSKTTEPNVRLVACYRSLTDTGELKPTIPKALMTPSFQLTDDEVKELETYLGGLQKIQPPQVQIPIQEDADSAISDAEDSDYSDKTLPKVQNIRLRRVSKPSIKQLYYQYDKVYEMTHPIRGRAMIINICEGSQGEGLSSVVDYSNLSRLFEELGFDLVKTQRELTNLTAQEVYSEIKQETSRPKHHDLGMFVLVLMGLKTESDTFLDINGVQVSLNKIQEMLSPNHFQAMEGKPKLLIVHGCTADPVDRGDFPVETPSETPEPLPFPLHTSSSNCALSSESVFEAPEKPPTLNTDDFMVLESPSEAYGNSMSKTHGSWYIRILVTTFYKHSHSRDIETLFKIIQQRSRQVGMSLSSKGTDTGELIPTIRCTFTDNKKLHLFPGFPRNTLNTY